MTELEDKLFIENASTSQEFKQRYLNTCLCYLAAMIAVRKKRILSAVAISPIMLYNMVKLFHCSIHDEEWNALETPTTNAQCKEYIDKYTYVRIEVHDLVYEDLYQNLLASVEKINCTGLGGKRTRRVKKFYYR